MDLRDIDTAGVEDVTDALGETNPANRLLQLPSGQVVKVKTFELARVALQPASDRVFQITTSLTDSEGAAIPGSISAVEMLTTRLRPDGPTHSEQLNDLRKRLAVWAPTALSKMDEELPGVAPAP